MSLCPEDDTGGGMKASIPADGCGGGIVFTSGILFSEGGGGRLLVGNVF